MINCLIVDDSQTVRSSIKGVMQEFSFAIQEASNGEEAFTICSNQMPDLIILDWNMPVMNGIEFLEKLRSHPNGGNPKVIFCTTENELSKVKEALSKGADEYVSKPFDRDIIQEKLEELNII